MDIHRGPAPRAQTASSPGTAAKQTQAGTSSAVNVKPTQPGTTSAHASAPDPNLPAGLYEHLITELLQQRLGACHPTTSTSSSNPSTPPKPPATSPATSANSSASPSTKSPPVSAPSHRSSSPTQIIRLIAREIDTVDLQARPPRHPRPPPRSHHQQNRSAPRRPPRAGTRNHAPHPAIPKRTLHPEIAPAYRSKAKSKKKSPPPTKSAGSSPSSNSRASAPLLPALTEFTQHGASASSRPPTWAPPT
jgi:hypothetical protein